jgi:hypothetical protein
VKLGNLRITFRGIDDRRQDRRPSRREQQVGEVRQDGPHLAFERNGVGRVVITIGHPQARVDDERGAVRPVPVDGGFRDA